MQLAGPGVWGPPKDPDGAVTVLREVVAAGVNHIDTADFWPAVTNHTSDPGHVVSCPPSRERCRRAVDPVATNFGGSGRDSRRVDAVKALMKAG
jgi:hypothetical protein